MSAMQLGILLGSVQHLTFDQEVVGSNPSHEFRFCETQVFLFAEK